MPANQVSKQEPKVVTVRLPVETYGKVVELAEAQRRSIHGQIVWAVEQHVGRESE